MYKEQDRIKIPKVQVMWMTNNCNINITKVADHSGEHTRQIEARDTTKQDKQMVVTAKSFSGKGCTIQQITN